MDKGENIEDQVGLKICQKRRLRENLIDPNIVEIPSIEAITPNDPERRSPSHESPMPTLIASPCEECVLYVHEENEEVTLEGEAIMETKHVQ